MALFTFGLFGPFAARCLCSFLLLKSQNDQRPIKLQTTESTKKGLPSIPELYGSG